VSAGFTQQLTKFLLETRYEDIPSDCLQIAKLCLLDFLGVSLIGSREPAGRILNDFLTTVGGSPEATIIGYGEKSTALNAALANGTFGHCLDFDDDSSIGAGHLTTCVGPTLIALAEKMKKGGTEILLGFVLGYEIGSILAAALEPEQTRKGWHATSTIGTFASTAGAAKILDLKEGEVSCAFGIAATQTSGLRRNFGTMCKPFHAGKAAQKGVESALLAQKGFTGNKDIFGGIWGVFEIFSGRSSKIEGLAETLGNRFLIRENWFKPYPSCGCTHSAIDAAISLRHQYEIEPVEIEKIEVGVLPVTFDTLLYDRPETPYQAKFSMPFCISTAILEGKVLADQFSSSRIKDPLLLDLMKKVVMVADPELAKGGYRGTYGATLRIKMTSGKILTEKVQAPRGHPQNRLSKDALIDKYRNCAQSLLSSERIDASIDMVMNFEKMNRMEPLMRLMKWD